MSTERSVGALSDPDREPAAGPSQGQLPVASVLALCDRVLGEVGRRQHRFAWLRATDGQADLWLPVDAYFPGRRLVVFCRELPEADEARVAELVPARGLALLRLVPDDLGGDREAARRRIADMVSALPIPERREPMPPASPSPTAKPREGAISRIATSLSYAAPSTPSPPRPHPDRSEAVLRATRHIAASPPAVRPVRRPDGAVAPRRPRAVPRRPRLPPRPAARSPDPGADLQALALAVCLMLVLAVELYAVAKLAVAGELTLSVGLAFDGCSRVLGTIAARRAGQRAGADWACALGGAPVVAAVTLFGRDGPVAAHPAPLAGVVSVLATVLVVIGGLGALG